MSGRGGYILNCTDTNVRNQDSQKNEVNVIPPKETKKALIANPKEIELWIVRIFRIILLKKFNEL